MSGINLQKQRQIGEIIQDTFAFIRQEFKPLLGALIRIAGPWMLITLLVFAYFIYSFGGPFSATASGQQFEDELLFPLLGSYTLLLVLSVLIYVLTQGTILHYIRLYQIGQSSPKGGELRSSVYGSFWSILGLTILVILTLLVGFMLCLLPGFYLMVPLFLSFPLMIFRQVPVGEAFSDSFRLIRDNWWRSFGLILLLYILVTIGSSVMVIPTYIYQIFIFMSSSNLGDVQSAGMQDPIYIVLNIIAMAVQYLLSMILPIGTCLLYFDLDERQRGTGALMQIEGLGEASQNRNRP